MKKLMRQVWKTGTYAEVKDVWCGANAQPRGTTRSARGLGGSRPAQVENNEKQAVRRLNAKITGNFSYEHGDQWICLTLDGKHLCTLDELDHRGELFLRAAARLCRKKGKPFKWIFAPTDRDGDSGELVRPHIHMILSGSLTTDELRRLWRYGTVDVRTIRREKSHKRLAAYIVRQARHTPNAKKWRCSRNLAVPRLMREFWVEPGQKYRLPNGAVECEREYDPDAGKQLYLAYRTDVDEYGEPQEGDGAPPKKGKRGGKPTGTKRKPGGKL